jgi:hypothetical protein
MQFKARNAAGAIGGADQLSRGDRSLKVEV